MTSVTGMPQYDGMGYEELVSSAQFLWLENAKLRKLLLELWRSCPVSEHDCKRCLHHMGESNEDWCDIPIRMQELGIEVDV